MRYLIGLYHIDRIWFRDHASRQPGSKNDFFNRLRPSMDRTLVIEQHSIEGWGLWWIRWQKDTKEQLLRYSMSQQVSMSERVNKFSELHLNSVGSEGKDLPCNSATQNLVLASK